MRTGREQTTHITLELLLHLLVLQRQSCCVRATIAAATLAKALGEGKVSEQQPSWLIALGLHHGRVISATISNAQGTLLALGEPALQLGRRCGVLFWTLEPEPQNEARVSSLHDDTSSISLWSHYLSPVSRQQSPCQVQNLAPEKIEALPRKQRQVLFLLNGQRSIGEICRMLNCPFAQLSAMLDELLAQHYIALPHTEEYLTHQAHQHA